MTEPTNLQILIAEINQTGKSEYIGAVKAMSVRLQLPIYQKVMGISSLLGSEKTSKNKIINDLLAIAVDQVYDNLTAEQKQVIDQVPVGLHFSDDPSDFDSDRI